MLDAGGILKGRLLYNRPCVHLIMCMYMIPLYICKNVRKEDESSMQDEGLLRYIAVSLLLLRADRLTADRPSFTAYRKEGLISVGKLVAGGWGTVWDG